MEVVSSQLQIIFWQTVGRCDGHATLSCKAHVIAMTLLAFIRRRSVRRNGGSCLKRLNPGSILVLELCTGRKLTAGPFWASKHSVLLVFVAQIRSHWQIEILRQRIIYSWRLQLKFAARTAGTEGQRLRWHCHLQNPSMILLSCYCLRKCLVLPALVQQSWFAGLLTYGGE